MRAISFPLPWIGALVLVGVVGFSGGRATVRQPWPSYAPLFDRVASGVVNVSVEPSGALGSGFVVGGQEVVTARHLVLDQRRVTIRDLDGRAWPAEVVGMDARADLALLRVGGADLPPASLGTTHRLRIGDPVLAIGNPYGLGHSLSVGVVAGRGRRVGGVDRVDFLQVSVPLNPGNSGGPVFDTSGAVIGVLAGLHTQGQAIAFVVPVEVLTTSLSRLRKGEEVSRAFVGFRVEEAPAGDGVVVVQLVVSSSAAAAGVREGDRLVAIDDRPVGSEQEFSRILDELNGGRWATVDVVRGAQRQRYVVELEDWAEYPVVIAGMTLAATRGAGGQVVAVTPGSRADRAGVQRGDLVRAVDGAPVRAPVDVRDALLAGGMLLDLIRAGVPVTAQLAAVPQ